MRHSDSRQVTTESTIVQPGSRLGRYEVIALVGRGGMGEVFRARDGRLKRDVAIKVLRPDLTGDAMLRRRFELEAQATASLAHPNVVSVFDFETHEGFTYLVTEFVFGDTLRRYLARRRVPYRTAANWAAQLAAGLAAAHEKGIVHRDLKPENVLVTPDNRVKICDFGIAKLAHGVGTVALSSTQATEPGIVLGTVRYMAPEQLRGSVVKTASDVFSLGLVLHELLTARPFFSQPDVLAVIAALTSFRKYQPPRAKYGDDGRLVRLIARCLMAQPSARPRAAQLENELRRLSLATRSERRVPSKPPTQSKVASAEARRAWSKARFLLDTQLENWCEESFTALQKAIDLAPTFVPARIELSRWYVRAALRGQIAYESGLRQAIREAEHAATIEPGSTEVLTALARAYYASRRFHEAEDIFQQVLATTSRDVAALCAYSELLSLLARHAEALDLVDRALADEPLNVIVHCRKAAALFCARLFDQCVDSSSRALEIGPKSSELHYFAGTALLMVGAVDDAIRHIAGAIDLEPHLPMPRAAMVVALHRAGREADSNRLLSELESSDVDPALRAEAYAGVGRLDDALECLEQGFRRDSPHMVGIAVNALLDPVRGHVRFRRLVEALGLPTDTRSEP